MSGQSRKRKRKQIQSEWDASMVRKRLTFTKEEICCLTERWFRDRVRYERNKSELNEAEEIAVRFIAKSIKNRLSAKRSRDRRKQEREDYLEENKRLKEELQTLKQAIKQLYFEKCMLSTDMENIFQKEQITELLPYDLPIDARCKDKEDEMDPLFPLFGLDKFSELPQSDETNCC
jgi:hypothetical protein